MDDNTEFWIRAIILHMLMPAFMFSMVAWRKIKYKYWDWLCITLGLILLAPWPFIWWLNWMMKGV